jgi:hypothetical protein
MVAAIHKIVHGCCDLLVRGYMDRNYHGAKLSISVSVLYVYLGFTALLPECHLYVLWFTSFIHLWEETSLPQSSVYVLRCFAMWNSVKWISLLVLHHSSITISIAEIMYGMQVGIFFVCKHVRHFDCDCTATQHSHACLGSVQAGT